MPADDFYSRLVQGISVDAETNRTVRGWLDQAVRRVLCAIRPHALDVDGIVCGSFAKGTHIATEEWDIDLIVRIHSAPSDWRDSGKALDAIRRWLSHGIDASIESTGSAIKITSLTSLTLDVVPCWRPVAKGPGLAYPSGEIDGTPDRLFDPAGHRDLIAARNASLGTDSLFIKLIRIVKHLNERWGRERRRRPLSGFHIEALALAHCTKPFLLAEGVASFLAEAANMVQRPLDDPLGAAPPLVADDPGLASGLLAEAAELTESALMTADSELAEHVLAGVFGGLRPAVDACSERLQCPDC